MNQIKFIFIIFLISTSAISYTQEINHSVYIAPNFTYKPQHKHKTFEYKPFSGSFAYQIEYLFKKTFGVQSAIGYNFTKNNLFSECHFYGTIFGGMCIIQNSISSHSLDIPLIFKFQSKKQNPTFITGGLGFSWVFYSYLNIYRRESADLLELKDLPKVKLLSESFSLNNKYDNSFGFFYQLGIGQNFHIKELHFFAELSFKKDINEWVYEETLFSSVDKYEPNYYYFKRNNINLKIGFIF